ncbi:hypothetical protein EVAR_49519_1 [Eumeta japonica]|uniref:Uncharacterized protein n=1 Tax=Eumeta variegata TaxID=151549 RepID=A0A4C1XHU0_EUMVA|nr:hypothetical protein EVAR_49519_1 [Eumeta japonica]
MALLQHLSTRPPEEQLYRSTKALARLAHVSHDVPQYVQMIGPSPNEFRDLYMVQSVHNPVASPTPSIVSCKLLGFEQLQFSLSLICHQFGYITFPC